MHIFIFSLFNIILKSFFLSQTEDSLKEHLQKLAQNLSHLFCSVQTFWDHKGREREKNKSKVNKAIQLYCINLVYKELCKA